MNDGVSQTLKALPDGSRPALVFPTASGKAVFFARPHTEPAEMPAPEFPIVLNTGRLQHQWHTMTKTGKIPMLNKLNAGPFVEIHPEDATALGIGAKDRVEVRSRRGRAVLPAVVTDRVRAGSCFAPMHWNDVFGDDLCINAVTNDAVDPVSQQPELKFCAVALTRVASEPVTAMNDLDHSDASHSGIGTAVPTLATDVSSPKERDMSRIDALVQLLGLPEVPAPQLDDAQRAYVAGFIGGLRASPRGQADGVPVLPPSAPLPLGHSQIRHRYRLNSQTDPVPLFPDLLGFRVAPREHVIDWSLFFDAPGAPPAQRSKKINGNWSRTHSVAGSRHR